MIIPFSFNWNNFFTTFDTDIYNGSAKTLNTIYANFSGSSKLFLDNTPYTKTDSVYLQVVDGVLNPLLTFMFNYPCYAAITKQELSGVYYWNNTAYKNTSCNLINLRNINIKNCTQLTLIAGRGRNYTFVATPTPPPDPQDYNVSGYVELL